MAKNDDDAWFAPKRIGYGAGLPIRWQGWVLTGGYALALLAAGLMLAERHSTLFIVIALLLTAAMIVIAANHTRGGWRWRWGKDN